MSRIMRSHSGGKAAGIIFLVIAIIIILLTFIGIGYASTNGSRILKGVTINNAIDIGDLTKEDAKQKLAEYQTLLDEKPYLLRFEEDSITFHGRDIEVGIDDSIVEKAFALGKDGNVFSNGLSAIKSFLGAKKNIDTDVYFNEKLLYQKVDDLIASTGSTPVDSTYEIKDDSIEISKGHDGVKTKLEDLRKDINASLGDVDSASDITVKADIERANEIDIDELYEKVYVPKKDASIDKDGKYTMEQIGISFDKAKALSDYRALPNDTKMTIKLVKEEPEITTKNLESVLFADKLGEYTTRYNASNTNRSTNLALAANNINGKVFLPGEVFSYNKEVGERTSARGFKEAHIFSGGKVENGLGGGICQISSTLYCATLIADLEIVERKNHQLFPEYVDPSLDATVAWGSVDYKFKNSRTSPIKIEASAKGGIAKVIIWGKKEDDEPTITLKSVKLATYQPSTQRVADATMAEGQEKVTQNAVNGYKSEGYKVYKDIKGKVIKEVKVSTDEYRATNKIISYGTKKAVTPVAEETPATTPSQSNPLDNNPATTDTPAQTTPAVEEQTPATTPTPTPQVEEPTKPVEVEKPVVEEPSKPTESSSSWPTGWDTPENPNFRG